MRSYLYGDRDHPRSRGVYLCVEVGWLPQNGSSPLARGLLWGAGRFQQ